MRKLDNDSLMQGNRYGESQLKKNKKGEDMKLHYYESILNFYCDSPTEEELLEKIREWTLRYLWYRKKREEEEGGNENTRVR